MCSININYVYKRGIEWLDKQEEEITNYRWAAVVFLRELQFGVDNNYLIAKVAEKMEEYNTKIL
jgi:hypothetical protein